MNANVQAIAHGLPRGETHDERRTEFRYRPIDGVLVLGPGEIHDRCSGLQTRPHHVGLVRLDRDGYRVLDQCANHGDQLLDLSSGVRASSIRPTGLGSDIDDMRTLGSHDQRTAHGVFESRGDALAVGRVPRQVDNTHNDRLKVGIDAAVTDTEGCNGMFEVRTMLIDQVR